MGGQIYRHLKIQYRTPTVGLWIEPRDYLRYIDEFDLIHQSNFKFLTANDGYPVAIISGVKIHFLHYKDYNEAIEKYWSRYRRLSTRKRFFKIDFGKRGYRIEDIKKWNMMKIPNSLALYPIHIEIPGNGVHNGIAVNNWTADGAAMFNISRKYFDVFYWLRRGSVKNSVVNKVLNTIFLTS